MKLIIDIPEYVIDDMKECSFIPEEDNEELYKAIDNGTPIPENATNGDVIKTMFSNGDDYESVRNTICYVTCLKEWWNNPYQKGSKDEVN